MAAYETYVYWSYIPACGILLLLVTVFVILIGIYLCFKPKHLLGFFYMCSKIIYRYSLTDEEVGEREFFLHKYLIHWCHLLIYCAITTLTLWGVFVSFWATFLVDETHVCDSSLDCFVTGDERVRVEDCATVKNVSVDCFEFVLSVTEGFAAATGFVAVMVLYVYIFGALHMWFLKSIDNSYDCKYMFKIAYTFYIAVSIMICVVIAIVTFTVPLFHDIVIETEESLLKFIAYWICLSSVPIGSLISVIHCTCNRVMPLH